MTRAATSTEMRAIDAAAVARDGEIALMRRAGEAIAALVPRYARPGPIVGIAGCGNNGGDVFAALAALDPRYERIVYGEPTATESVARTDARDRARAAGVIFRPLRVDPSMLRDAGLVLDGILGANARLPLDPVRAALVASVDAAGSPVLAIDVPSGIDPSTGEIGEPCIHAVATLALGMPKLGCFLEPARDVVGELWLADLGMRPGDAPAGSGAAHVMTDREFARLLPRRSDDAEKRSAGAPLLVAGSEQFPGAAILCARGAARAGAGYVTVATTAAAAPAVRAHLVEQVVTMFDDGDVDLGSSQIGELRNHCGAIGIGPGLGLNHTLGDIVRRVIVESDLPMVADASALFHLGKHLDILRDKPIVLTPHAGEFARLSGGGTLAAHERLARLRAFVENHGVVTLLKGRSTLIADEATVHVNPSGTSALATAGTGDVLTGMIATLLAQGLRPLDAARVGAYWHGRAGRLAARRRPIGVLAGDLPDLLADAATIEEPGDGPVRIF